MAWFGKRIISDIIKLEICDEVILDYLDGLWIQWQVFLWETEDNKDTNKEKVSQVEIEAGIGVMGQQARNTYKPQKLKETRQGSSLYLRDGAQPLHCINIRPTDTRTVRR